MNIQHTLDKLRAKVLMLQERISSSSSLQNDLARQEQLEDDIPKAIAFILSLSESRQLILKKQIEDLVTRGIQEVFDDSLRFVVEYSTKYNSTSVNFFVETLADPVIKTPVISSRGGGLVAVVGFLLQVALLSLTTPAGYTRLLVLDEPFAHLSRDRTAALANFVKQLTEAGDIQIVMVSHDDAFIELADVAYKVSLKNNKSEFGRIT